MLYSFKKKIKDLPSVLPLFPLNRVLLFPRSRLPLNLFENRYLHMFDYALSNSRLIGLIQPKIVDLEGKKEHNPFLYNIGCAGYITAFSETQDNRYEIILRGLCRFNIKKELSLLNGFRRAKIDWGAFKDDLVLTNYSDQKERKNFEAVLKDYLSKESITIDWETIKTSDDEELVNAISMGCPFDTNEKQALLEAKSLSERIKVLISLMQMSLKENKSTKPKSFS